MRMMGGAGGVSVMGGIEVNAWTVVGAVVEEGAGDVVDVGDGLAVVGSSVGAGGDVVEVAGAAVLLVTGNKCDDDGGSGEGD